MSYLGEDFVIRLQETNTRLRFWLDQLNPGLSNQVPQPASPKLMNGLLTELMRAGQWLRSLPEPKGALLQEQLSQYRSNVELLRDLLPTIHEGLLRERARLEQERTRLQYASEWARRSRETL